MRITQKQLRQIIREEAARVLREGTGDSGDYEGRIDAWDGDDSDMGPPSKDDWEVDAAPSYDDTEGSDFDELITPADDNDDPMNPAWMNPSPYADTDDDTWGDDSDWGRSSATGRARDKYRATGNSDPEDAYTHSSPRGLDETEDSNYNADLQQKHGRFTSPENVKGTSQHKQKHSPPAPAPTQGGGGGWDYSEYDNLHYGPGINEARWAKLSGVLKD